MSPANGELLVDTDMLILLTASGMLNPVARRLGYSPSQVRRLSPVVHQIRKSKRMRDTYGEQILASIVGDIEQIACVDPPPITCMLDALSKVVDVGEALLMTVAASTASTLLVSGDKRAIRDLAASGPKSCVRALNGRIVCLEAVIWMLIEDLGLRAIQTAFSALMHHKTLGIILGNTGEAECLEAARSYYNDLHATADDTLYNPAPGTLGSTI